MLSLPLHIEIFKCSQTLIPCRITQLFTIFPNFMKSFALTSAVFTNVSTPYIKIRILNHFTSYLSDWNCPHEPVSLKLNWCFQWLILNAHTPNMNEWLDSVACYHCESNFPILLCSHQLWNYKEPRVADSKQYYGVTWVSSFLVLLETLMGPHVFHYNATRKRKDGH